MTAAGNMTGTAVISEWARHHSMTRQVAARLARELALRPAQTRVDSSMKIAARYGVSHTMAVNARYLLMGARLVHKNGRHYYTGPPAAGRRIPVPVTETDQASDTGRGADERV